MTGSAPEWEEANRFFNDLWRKGDPWELETSAFERAKYDAQLSLLQGRRYGRTLEIGCAAGVFTNRLARHCEEVIAVDASSVAIERAQKISAAPNIDFQVGNIMDWKDDLDRDWDLVVCAETLCYLGWLYPFFDVAWIAHQLYQGTRPGGRLLLASTCGGTSDYLLLPFVIRSYHDLFRNVGYRTIREQTFRGVKNGVEIEALITLAERPA